MAGRAESIANALDAGERRGAVTSWYRVSNSKRPWVVSHRGNSPLGGDAFTTAEAEAFCKGMAADDQRRGGIPKR